MRPPKEWIIPANPKYYDIQAAFRTSKEIDWKQGKIRQLMQLSIYVWRLNLCPVETCFSPGLLIINTSKTKAITKAKSSWIELLGNNT